MIWHLARAFTRQELRAHAGREAQIHLAYQPELGYYEFRISAGERGDLKDVLLFLDMQVDRMRAELTRPAQ